MDQTTPQNPTKQALQLALSILDNPRRIDLILESVNLLTLIDPTACTAPNLRDWLTEFGWFNCNKNHVSVAIHQACTLGFVSRRGHKLRPKLWHEDQKTPISTPQ